MGESEVVIIPGVIFIQPGVSPRGGVGRPEPIERSHHTFVTVRRFSKIRILKKITMAPKVL